MAGTRNVPASGVYRNDAGHAVYLEKGDEVSEELLKTYKKDDAASKAYHEAPERNTFGTIVDAPQDQEQRAEPPLENRAEPPVENRTDAQLAAAARKRADAKAAQSTKS